MAPGIPLERHIKQYIEENLSLEIRPRQWGSDGTLIIRLKLGDKVIGKSYAIKNSIVWERDRGHGGGSYVDRVDLGVDPSIDADEE
jgi:hypothetical protein